MRELLILFGVLIGWVLGYVFQLYMPKKRKEEGLALQKELSEAKDTIRRLEAQLGQYQHLQEQLNACDAQLQQKIAELEDLNAKSTSAEARIETLQQHITSLEQKIQAATEPPAAEIPPQTDMETPQTETSPEVEEAIPQTVEPETLIAEIPQAVEEAIPRVVEPETLIAEIPQAVEPETPLEEVPPTVEAEKEPESVRSTPEEKDNLRKIEGIGPKVAQLLNDAGILTFEQLAQTPVDRLRGILEEAGGIFKAMDPASWPEQAGLAAKGDWEGLQILQDQLDGGRYRS